VNWNDVITRFIAALLAATTNVPHIPVEPEVAVPTASIRVVVDSTAGASVLPNASSGSNWKKDPEVSWYGPGFYGKRTACGEAYTTEILGVAHRTLPCGTLVEFKYSGITKTVPVIDRGPYVEGRTWDLSGGLCTLLHHCFTGPIEWRFP
jgi:rare lipoprotein A (peptidoglycan hydrolase)